MWHDFLAAVAAHPGRSAIAHNGHLISYLELRERALAVADRLGAAPGVVAVTATRSPETLAALWGVWAAGGTWCPVDPAYPPARQQAMLAAAGCRLRFDPARGDVTPLPVDAGPSPAVDVPAMDVPAVDVPAVDVPAVGGPAYLLFTSGSTGEPKPVATPGTAIGVASRSVTELFGIGPADRVLQFASLNWDTCFEEILPALTGGARLVLHDDAHRGSLPRFLGMVERERVSVLDLPTAYWHELVLHLRAAGAPLPGCVRLVVIGGEAVNPARLVEWCALPTGHARLLNTYGCTETTLITHAVDLHGPLAGRTGWRPADRVPIGRPLPHVREHLSADGELLVGGASLADGYHGRPEATAERFVTVDGRRLFRTGDRVTRLPDGGLCFAGRIDHEIKVRGIRVDPAEVEAHLAGHPGVGAVVVTGVESAGRTVLAAYVVASPGSGSAGTNGGLAARLTDYLCARVPSHLVPAQVHLVADLPRTATGKVDRHRIKEVPR